MHPCVVKEKKLQRSLQHSALQPTTEVWLVGGEREQLFAPHRHSTILTLYLALEPVNQSPFALIRTCLPTCMYPHLLHVMR